jgi:hypothetical protein
VHFDLPPSPEREQRDWVLVAGDGPHGRAHTSSGSD